MDKKQNLRSQNTWKHAKVNNPTQKIVPKVLSQKSVSFGRFPKRTEFDSFFSTPQKTRNLRLKWRKAVLYRMHSRALSQFAAPIGSRRFRRVPGGRCNRHRQTPIGSCRSGRERRWREGAGQIARLRCAVRFECRNLCKSGAGFRAA